VGLDSLISGAGRKSSAGGCPACDGGEKTVQFDWKLASDAPDSEFHIYTQTLVEKKPLKTGFFFECPHCEQSWYLDSKRERMSLIPLPKSALLERWNSSPLSLTPDLFNKCREIGATPAHRSSAERNYAEVPCKVRTHQSELLDKCLLFFKGYPPLGDFLKPLRWADEITELHPSDYSLPFPVRFNTSQSQPDEKGRCLTRVTSVNGLSFSLNWTVNFLDHKGVQGKEIRLNSGELKGKKVRAPILTEPMKEITFFMADWNENARQLLMPKPIS